MEGRREGGKKEVERRRKVGSSGTPVIWGEKPSCPLPSGVYLSGWQKGSFAYKTFPRGLASPFTLKSLPQSQRMN